MAVGYAPVADFAPVVTQPSDLLPVFLLVFQEDTLVLQIFPNFHHDVRGVVDFAADVECFDGIGDVPNCVLLGLSVLDWHFSLFVIFINGKEVDATF